MKRKKRKGEGVLHRLRDMLLGQEMLPVAGGGYRLEMVGGPHGVRVVLSGGLRILAATDREVSLMGKGVRLHLLGSALVCLTYEGGVAEIEGHLEALSVEELR